MKRIPDLIIKEPYEVEWEDAVSTYGWHSIKEEAGMPLHCYSIGYLLLNTRKALTLVVAYSVQPSGELNNIDTTLTLPWKGISSVRRMGYADSS